MRGLCRDRQGLEELEKQGVDIMQVDYQDENKMKQAVQESRCVFMIPEHSSNRVKEAEMLMRVAKQAKVEHMAMLSWVGMDAVQHDRERWRHLNQYHQIEEKLKQQFGEHNCCIIRSTMFNQFFYYVTPMVEDRNALCLPVKQDQRWGTVDLRDVVEAICKLVRHNIQVGRGQGQKQLYRFTPTHLMNGQEMARGMAEAVERSPDELKYHQIKQEEMWQHLKRIRDDERFRERQPGGGTETRYTVPIGRYLNDHCIELLLEFMELASRGKAEIKSHDLKEILGREPQPLHEYFKKNRDQFKRFR
ncbi:hypothetical protein K492DRAFT_121308 [Lichtheimia hyalospora FSU 10163]|nr:hypothetical protein K492DRAFT_121308 [Lichtheimia hyalospora FSU 10163]